MAGGAHPFPVVACIAWHRGTVLLLQEHGLYESAVWQVPSGPLLWGESVMAAAVRHALEQTGVEVRSKQVLAVTNDVALARGHHEVTLFVLCEYAAGEPEVKQPERFQRAAWCIASGVSTRCRELSLPLANLTNQNPGILLRGSET